MAEKTLFINGKEVAFDNEKNLLEVIRKAGISKFDNLIWNYSLCFHSEHTQENVIITNVKDKSYYVDWMVTGVIRMCQL